MPAYDLVERLVGLQAQEPRDPYVGLWSRLVDFDVTELETLLLDRRVGRLTVQPGTVHVVSADDCLVLRPLAQRVLTQQLHSHPEYGPRLRDVDLDAVMTEAAVVLAIPRSTAQLRAELATRFPQHDAAAMAFACRNLLPLIQVPPRGLWSRSGQVVGTTPLAWLGSDIDPAPSVDDVILRYVAAFGPATVQDAATWSRYTALREVFDRLRDKLRTFHDEDGREYFDVPDGPLPDPATAAPVRFLPQYDNLLLSHKDRRRFIAEDHDPTGLSSIWMEQTGFIGSVLIDGMVTGMWRIDVPKRRATEPLQPATLTVTTVRRLAKADATGVEREGGRFLQFACPDVDHAVRLQVIS
jgi:hypothetical protein